MTVTSDRHSDLAGDTNFTAADTETSLPARFEQIVGRFPTRIALSAERQCSYAELNRLANHIARTILARQIEDRPVALLLDHGTAVIAALLGALKAGRLWAALSPASPPALLGRQIDDLQAPLLITDSAHHALATKLSPQVLNLDDLDDTTDADNLNLVIEAETPAALFYTSGSTGEPKAVIRSHGAFLHRAWVDAHQIGWRASDRLSLLLPCTYGNAMSDVFNALLNGATLAPFDAQHRGLNELTAWLRAESITFLHIPVALLRQWLQSLIDDDHFPALRHVRPAGRLLRSDLERLWPHVPPDAQVFSQFASGETGLVTRMHFTRQTPVDSEVLPVGWPVTGTDVLLLDDQDRPVVVGEVGRIHVRTRNLSSGYWRRPDLNAETFLPDPNGSNAHVCRTQDWGRWRTDGCLEFVGRRDDVVKVRGHRVETAAVQAALQSVSGVLAAAVTAQDHPLDGPRLLAFIVPGDPAPTADQLRTALAATLPEHAIPEVFVPLAELPLLPSGKLDARMLPAPAGIRPHLTTTYRAPSTSVEEALTSLWAEILEIDCVGVDDRFLDLGGNSLRAMRLIARVQPLFEVELPPSLFFQAATIGAQARAIEALRAGLSPGEGRTDPARTPQAPALRKRGDQEPVILAHTQSRVWFLARLDPDSTPYNQATTHRLTGAVNVAALQASLRAVLQRHEIMRTTFALIEGEPRQIVHPEARLDFQCIDLTSTPSHDQRHTLMLLVEAEERRPFDFETGPLVRYRLIQLADNDYVLLWVANHIILDAWSTGIFNRELSAAYGAFVKGEVPSLPPLPIQYADYAVWQRERLQGETLTRQLSYWTQQLADLPVLELPTDRPRPPVASHRGAQLTVDLPGPLTTAVKEFGRCENSTLFMTLLAAFQVLLHRYAGQSDIAVGSTIAGRGRPELEGLIGFFANTLVLRADLSGQPTFRAVLARVRETALGAYTHEDLPFEQLVEKLSPARDLSRNPLFQVMFALQNAPQAALALDQVEVTRLPLDSHSAKFDLNVAARETTSGLTVRWEYATDLFDAATIARMAGHFETLLTAIVTDPERRIAELPLLTPHERHQLLVDWNATTRDYPHDRTVHEVVEAQAARTPAALAVTCAGQQLTYAEINARANQVAHRLMTLGVGPEVLVGVCLERSLDLIVALLGILKAGGAYVPLDPGYPLARLAIMVGETLPPVVLTQQRLLDRLPSTAAHVVCLDRDADVLAAHPITNPPCRATAGQLAYVLYTSGSTGAPKGVMIEHRSLLNYLWWLQGEFALAPDDRVLHHTPTSFDISVLELFWPLLAGASLEVAPPDAHQSPMELVKLVRQRDITVLQVVPSMLDAIVEGPGLAGLASLRRVFTAGEVLGPDLVRRFQTQSAADLVNGYGPTETTVYSTFWRIPPDARGAVPIGRPVANTRVSILDAYGAPVPVGVAGEVYIAGDGVARGYFRRPGLTAERFVRDHFGGDSNAVMYRTGDRARYRADGAIEFLGRVDDQLKIRGFRIEPGEIEAVLASHPAVRQAVVVARTDATGEKRLVAYVVPAQPSEINLESLYGHLRERLPDFMRPTACVPLERLPLTPNGKLDRSALPDPDCDRSGQRKDLVAARSALEEVIAEIWREVLSRDEVGVHDDFFAMGGHSLRAVQVVVRLARLLGVEVPLRVFFEHPTVSGLAAEAHKRLGTADTQAIQPFETPPTGAERPLSYAQQRMWLLDRLLPDTAVYNVPTTVRLRGRLDMTALQRSLDNLVARHEALRTRFTLRQEEPVQVIDAPQPVTLTVTDLSTTSSAERETRVRQIVNAHACQPFDLEADPPLRATLLRLSPEEHVLQLIVHHIASDGWSMGIVNRELSAAYGAFIQGEVPQLPALPIQYADYAVWQRAWLQGDVLARQLEYWKEQLADLPTLELPTDRPRPPVASHRGAHLTVGVAAALTTGLRQVSRREDTTLFMTLVAAFQVLLHRYTGQVDFAVGSPIAGRGRPELEGLIGFFVNTLVLRADLSGDPTFCALLARLRETALGAFTHQDLPFERLVEELAPARDLSRHPVFQVMFVLQNAPAAALALEGVEATRLSRDNPNAKFDLTVAVREVPTGLTVRWEYAADLFDAATIARMAGHFETLLAAIVADPKQPVATLPLLTPAERHQLLVDWNDTATDYPSDRCIHQLVEAQAARTPTAVAVACDGQQVTYAELNARANQVAHQLVAWGIGPDVLVGLCVERSLDLVVGLLGILKAGGAYVPLDPTYPAARLAGMVSETRPPVLLTQESLVDRLPLTSARTLCLDRDAELLAAQPRTNPACRTTARHLAYVLYTSGSTGVPKGVMIEHRSITRLVCDTNYITLGPTDCVAQVSNASFDAATFEIWGALANGARLTILPREVTLDPPRLADALGQEGVTTLFLTTALFNELVRADPSAFSTLKQLLFGGETVDPQYVGACLRTGAPQRLLHVYGPTETTTFATWHQVTSVAPGDRTIPIGRPIANTTAFVLDGNRQPVPVGVVGELYIGADGVSRGYWNQPDLTADRFVPDSFSTDPDARMYRTGDRVRYRADGALEFVGRVDDQLKLRGFRIEPGEIEAQLAAHPAVRQAVVLAREDTPGDKRLVAYVVPAAPSTLSSSDLRAFLRERLPEYQVPAHVVLLDALPLTPNGKVDRQVLPPPSVKTGKEEDAGVVPPANPLERQMAQIWEDLFSVHPIGVTDNFFDLGGHSLLAVHMMREIERVCGRQLPLTTLFEGATIKHLARALLDQGVEPTRSAVMTIHPGGSRRPLFFWHGDIPGGGMYCFELARDLGSDQPFYAIESPGLPASGPPLSIEEIARDQLARLRESQPQGPYLLGGYCHGGVVAFEVAQQLRMEGERVDLLFMIDVSLLPRRFRRIRRFVQETRAYRRRFGTFYAANWKERRALAMQFVSSRTSRNGSQNDAVPEPFADLLTAYGRATHAYEPRRYAGPVTLLQSADGHGGALDVAWRTVAENTRLHRLPGTHTGFFTDADQRRIIAGHLRRALEEAQTTMVRSF